jgi:hypothetical protein
MKATVIGAVIAAFALSGCSGMARMAGAPKKCQADREAFVSVEDDEYITVSPEPVHVCAQGIKITWKFANDVPSGYKFADLAGNGKKGIDIDDPTGQFESCGVEAGGNRYSCKDKGTSGTKAYKYVIYLVKPGGGLLKSIDPVIMND